MIIGQTLSTATTGSTYTHYFSPWFPAGGNRGAMTCNVIAHAGMHATNPFTIQVQTKSREQDDASASDVGSATVITLGGDPNAFQSWVAGAALDATSGQGMRELVRFKYSLKAAASTGGWVHFRMLQPQWFTN